MAALARVSSFSRTRSRSPLSPPRPKAVVSATRGATLGYGTCVGLILVGGWVCLDPRDAPVRAVEAVVCLPGRPTHVDFESKPVAGRRETVDMSPGRYPYQIVSSRRVRSLRRLRVSSLHAGRADRTSRATLMRNGLDVKERFTYPQYSSAGVTSIPHTSCS